MICPMCTLQEKSTQPQLPIINRCIKCGYEFGSSHKEVVLPVDTLFDMLTAFSFYITCPGSRIGFDVNSARIMYDRDIVLSVCKKLFEFSEEINNGILFGINFILDTKWKYDRNSFLVSDKHRCYAHEFEIKKPEKKKKDQRLQYTLNPLIKLQKKEALLERNYPSGTLGGKLIECREYYLATDLPEKKRLIHSYKMVKEILVGPIKPERREAERERVAILSGYLGDTIYSCGLDPNVFSNKASAGKYFTPYLPIKTMMVVLALNLFETFLIGQGIVVDGMNRDKDLILPLCDEPIDLERFTFIRRHPWLWKYQENESFWKSQGLLGCKTFTPRLLGTYGSYYDTKREIRT